MTGEKARDLSRKELQALPTIKAKMEEAKNQVKQYGGVTLEQKYDNLSLKRYAVVVWLKDCAGKAFKGGIRTV